jgi:hypothetical protein
VFEQCRYAGIVATPPYQWVRICVSSAGFEGSLDKKGTPLIIPEAESKDAAGADKTFELLPLRISRPLVRAEKDLQIFCS